VLDDALEEYNPYRMALAEMTRARDEGMFRAPGAAPPQAAADPDASRSSSE
jgi:hypothetical protein